MVVFIVYQFSTLIRWPMNWLLRFVTRVHIYVYIFIWVFLELEDMQSRVRKVTCGFIRFHFTKSQPGFHSQNDHSFFIYKWDGKWPPHRDLVQSSCRLVLRILKDLKDPFKSNITGRVPINDYFFQCMYSKFRDSKRL